MNLNFRAIGPEPAKNFEAEFEATSNFNLHIERTETGRITVWQRTGESSEYSLISGFGNRGSQKIIDVDCTAAVWPKSIKVVSETIPHIASVTFAQQV